MQCVKEPVNWLGQPSGSALVLGGICPRGHLSRGGVRPDTLLALSIKHVLAVLVVLLKMSHTPAALRQSGDGD